MLGIHFLLLAINGPIVSVVSEVNHRAGATPEEVPNRWRRQGVYSRNRRFFSRVFMPFFLKEHSHA